MKLQTLCLENSSPSITRPGFVQDPQKSLAIVFGSSSFLESPDRVQEVCPTFPGVPVIGFSTLGEVFGSAIQDHGLVGGILQFFLEISMAGFARKHHPEFTSSFFNMQPTEVQPSVYGTNLREFLLAPSLLADT
jgi:hypothetical protein